MNYGEESFYYYCHRNCNLCEGYDWMGIDHPDGCLVYKESYEPEVSGQSKSSDAVE